MKLLLTSSGIKNDAIRGALADLLGKPIAESSALFIPTGVYPYRGGAHHAWNPIGGGAASRMCQLGWKTLGLLEPSILPSIDREVWLPSLEEADALLVWGGDPLFISYWMEQSGLTALLPGLLDRMVYVGVSAGTIATAHIFAESYDAVRRCAGTPLTSQEMVFTSPDGDFSTTLITAKGMGLVDFAIIPHFEAKGHRDASRVNAEIWAGTLDVPVYAIDDDSAVKVDGGTIEVVSEGQWQLFMPKARG